MSIRQRLYRLGEGCLFLTGIMGLTELVMFSLGKGYGPPYYLAFTFIAGMVLTNMGESEG